MGYLPILLKDDGVRKTFSMFKMGYELFSNCAKLSSALVPRIQNDLSLNTLYFFVSNSGPPRGGAEGAIFPRASVCKEPHNVRFLTF